MSASCERAGGQASCSDLPFFSSASTQADGTNHVKVLDVYGHKLIDASPLPGGAGGGAGAGGHADASAPAPPPIAIDAGALGAGAGAIAACVPTVTAGVGGCSMTIDGTTCDCSDTTCIEDAVEQCIGDAGVPSLSLDAGGILPGPGLGGGAGCDPTSIDNAKQQFCLDVDSWLATHGLGSVSLDCAQIGELPTSITPPPASPAQNDCADITHDAFVKVRQTLATCNPCAYVTWDSSARLQLVEAGACDAFF
jgi:hypothetical protein